MVCWFEIAALGYVCIFTAAFAFFAFASFCDRVDNLFRVPGYFEHCFLDFVMETGFQALVVTVLIYVIRGTEMAIMLCGG